MSIPSWAKVGAKVVCVDDSYDCTGAGKEPLITAGTVYTVESISDPYIRLLEVEGAFSRYGGYRWRRFRPLVTRSQEQDIAEHFARHLHQNASRKTEERV